MKVLANENFPQAPDEDVMVRAGSESRLLVTFDQDFGELVYRRGLPPPAGVVLFRFAAPSPEQVAARAVAVLLSRSDWAGQFAVVEETRVRLRSLPTRTR